MNNILNEIGIENYFPFYDTFLYWGLLSIIQAKCNYRIYVCRNYAERSQSFVAFSTYHHAQGQIFVFFLWL
jgi:hypothetical protein